MEPKEQPKDVKMTLTATCFGSKVVVDGNEMKTLTKVELKSEVKDVTRLVLTGYALENVEVEGQMFVETIVLCPMCKQEIEKSEAEWKGKNHQRQVIDVTTMDSNGYVQKMPGAYLDPSALSPEDIEMIRHWSQSWSRETKKHGITDETDWYVEQAKSVRKKLGIADA